MRMLGTFFEQLIKRKHVKEKKINDIDKNGATAVEV